MKSIRENDLIRLLIFGMNKYSKKSENIIISFLARTSISAIGYSIKIGVNIDHDKILFNSKSLRNLKRR